MGPEGNAFEGIASSGSRAFLRGKEAQTQFDGINDQAFR
jgi:hypothetical protein